MGEPSRESSFVTGLPRLDAATPDPNASEPTSVSSKLRQTLTATAKGGETVQRTLGRNRPSSRKDVETPPPQPDGAETVLTPGQQARAKAAQQFDLSAVNFVNIPKVIQDSLFGAYSRFDTSQEETNRLRQDLDRFERMTRVWQERQQGQMDALKQALSDVTTHLAHRRPGHRHGKEDKKTFGFADAISAASGGKTPCTPKPGLGNFLRQQTMAHGGLSSKRGSPVHSPTVSRRPSAAAPGDSSDSDRSSIDEQVEANTNRIMGNAERISKIEKKQAERNAEMKALKSAVTGLRSHNEKVAVKLSTVWERLHTDLSFESLKDQIVSGALEAFPQWLSGAGATEEPTLEAAVSFFQHIASNQRKVERRLDCVESDVLALAEATPDPDKAKECTNKSGGASIARVLNTKSRVVISARCSVVDAEEPVNEGTANEDVSERYLVSADCAPPDDGPAGRESIVSDSKDFMNRRKSEASLKSMAHVASLLASQAELMEDFDEPVIRRRSSAGIPRTRSRQADYGSNPARLSTRASRNSVDCSSADLGGEAAARKLRAVAVNIEKQTHSIFEIQSQMRRLEEHVAFIDSRVTTNESMKADLDDCVEGARREAVKAVEQTLAQQNVVFKNRKVALAEEIRAEVTDSMSKLQASVEECLVRLDKESKGMADRIKVLFPKAFAQAQAGASDFSVSDARLFAFESRINELERKLAHQSSGLARRITDNAEVEASSVQQGVSGSNLLRVSQLDARRSGAASPFDNLLQSTRRSSVPDQSRESVKNTNSWASKRGSGGYRSSTKSSNGRNSPTSNPLRDSLQANSLRDSLQAGASGAASGPTNEDFGDVIDRFRAAAAGNASSGSDSDEAK